MKTLIGICFRRSKIGEAFLLRRFPQAFFQETLTLAGISIPTQEEWKFQQELEVLGEGFGEALLTRRSSPIFLF
jgi:hypothetical protein